MPFSASCTHAEKDTLFLVIKRLAHEFRSRNHEQRLPDTETETWDDPLEETWVALLLHHGAEHLEHILLWLSAVGSGLHLDTRDFKRVVPARERAADNTSTSFLGDRQLGIRVAVEQHFELATHDLSETLTRRPVGGLAERNRSATWVEALHSSRPYHSESVNATQQQH